MYYLSVIAPCYNEAEVLPEFHRRVTAICRTVGQPYEFVLVNDGSSDQTWHIMVNLAASDPNLVLVNLSRNHGHQLALTAGLSVCRGERVLILDADLQDPPELLPDMLRMLEEGADVVYAQRRSRPGDGALKKATGAVFYRVLRGLSDTNVPLDTGDFRLLSRRVVDLLNAMPERHRFLRGMISWLGLRQQPLLYDRDARQAGNTKYPIRKQIRLALDGVTNFSIKPLALASYAGMATTMFACGLLVYAFVSWLLRHELNTVPGWTSLMAAIAILGSVQLLVLGIIGAYLGRLYEQSVGRPLFVIDRIVRSETTETLRADDAAAESPSSKQGE
jgi:polyisoprenyl-phosphate glycosyltransferase